MSNIILIVFEKILASFKHFIQIIEGFMTEYRQQRDFGSWGWGKVKIQMVLKLPYKFYCTLERMLKDYTNLTVLIIN